MAEVVNFSLCVQAGSGILAGSSQLRIGNSFFQVKLAKLRS